MRPTLSLFAAQGSIRLLRDFIAHSLYDARLGYFAKQAPVAFLEPPIHFPSLSGRHAYLNEVKNRYAQLGTSWLTPAEIFSPHYGATLANYLATQHDQTHTANSSSSSSSSNSKTQPLVIYEIGGGTGTLAKDILNWLKAFRPQTYSTCQYKILEISPTLAELQRRRVAHNAGHEDCFDVVLGDAADSETWRALTHTNSPTTTTTSAAATTNDNNANEQCFVVAMEVLDNLPHDKVEKLNDTNNTDESGSWQETIVESPPPLLLHEELRPIQDPLIQRCLHAYLHHEELRPIQDPLIQRCLHAYLHHHQHQQHLQIINSKNGSIRNTSSGVASKLMDFAKRLVGDAAGQSVFLPTGALRLFDALHAARPNHRLIAMDFDYLPDTQIEGLNAPLVSSGIQDHATYLLPAGTADIFFPTHFELLRQLYIESGEEVARQRRKVIDPSVINPSAVGLQGSESSSDAVQRREVEVQKAGEFLKKWAPDGGEASATRSGYNPMFEDYTNTTMMIS